MLTWPGTLTIRFACLSVCAFSLMCGSQTANGSDTTQQLQSAVHRLNASLGYGAKAEGWRRYLWLNILETQSAKGEQADVAMLQYVHQRFASGAEGLEHPIFADVRIAIERQIVNLSQSNIPDLNYAVAAAAQQFQPITIDKMSYYRELATNELVALKYYYRNELSSYDRAQAFYDLKLDELSEYLTQIKFELAPEVSVGKLNSMIRDVREQLDEVIKKIDALPFDADATGNQEKKDKPQDAPAPDDEPTLDDLNKQQEKLELRIEELQEQRKEIGRTDADRIRIRAETVIRLREYEAAFETAAKTYGDPFFVSTRLAFERFVRAYFYGTADNLQEDFLVRIERLTEELPKLGLPSERLAAGIVGSNLEWMESAFQVPYLVTGIRARYSLPNVYVTISANLLNQAGSQTVRQTRPLNENISGRLVRGRTDTTGHVTFELQDDPNQIHLSIRTQADVTTNTYLQQGKITAYVDASGSGEARRSLFANIGGFYESEPYAAGSLDSDFRGTSSNCGLVQRIVQKQFDKNKAEADSNGGRRLRDELLERFAEQTAEPIAKGKSSLGNAQAKAKLKSNYVPELYARTQADKILLVGKKSTKATLAAPNYPTDHGIYSDVELRLHDSILSNYVEPIFSGKTYSDKELAEELESILGSKPDTLTPGPDEPNAAAVPAEDESFSITFANVRPIQFEFEENGFAVVVSGRRFSQGDSQIVAGLKIVLRFKIKRIDGKLKLVRDGKAEIDYIDPAEVNAKVAAFRSFLDGRLNPKDVEKQTDVELPENLLPIDKIDALKDSPIAKGLFLNQCRIEGGWLYVGWNYIPSNQYASYPSDLPAIWNEATIEQMDSIYTPVGESVPQYQIPLR